MYISNFNNIIKDYLRLLKECKKDEISEDELKQKIKETTHTINLILQIKKEFVEFNEILEEAKDLVKEIEKTPENLEKELKEVLQKLKELEELKAKRKKNKKNKSEEKKEEDKENNDLNLLNFEADDINLKRQYVNFKDTNEKFAIDLKDTLEKEDLEELKEIDKLLKELQKK